MAITLTQFETAQRIKHGVLSLGPESKLLLASIPCFFVDLYISMHSFEKLSLLLSFVAFGKYAHAQTTSSLYIPSVSDSGGLNPGAFLQASVVGTQNGITTYQLVLGSSEDEADDGPDPTLTLAEGSSTAHMFGNMVQDGLTISIDIQCNINGDASSCTETDLLMSGTVSSTSTISAFTESVSLVPVTLVSAFPGASATSNPAQPTSSPSGSGPGSSGSTGNSASSPPASSLGNPSIPAPSGGSSPAPAPSPTGSTNSSSSSSSPTTLNPPNSANSRIMSMSLLVLPLIVLPMLF